MKTARKIIERLIGEYTIESMSGEEVRVSNMPETDEDLNVALMQKQYGTWCLQSKKFLISDTVSPLSKQGMVASYIKGKISNYIQDFKNKDVMAMHYLYESDNIDVLYQKISMLARFAIYKDVEDIYKVPEETRKNSLAPETVSLYIGIYSINKIGDKNFGTKPKQGPKSIEFKSNIRNPSTMDAINHRKNRISQYLLNN